MCAFTQVQSFVWSLPTYLAVLSSHCLSHCQAQPPATGTEKECAVHQDLRIIIDVLQSSKYIQRSFFRCRLSFRSFLALLGDPPLCLSSVLDVVPGLLMRMETLRDRVSLCSAGSC